MLKCEVLSETNKLYVVNNQPIYLIDGFAFEGNRQKVVQYGILQNDLKKYAERGQKHALGHFFSLVMNGLILTEHIFEGLQRPLCVEEDMEGDKKKYVHSRKPACDYIWDNHDNYPKKVIAPVNQVFVVIISKNIHYIREFPEVHGWIERWSWVKEDSQLKGAPKNWVDRYDEKVFTRDGGVE